MLALFVWSIISCVTGTATVIVLRTIVNGTVCVKRSPDAVNVIFDGDVLVIVSGTYALTACSSQVFVTVLNWVSTVIRTSSHVAAINRTFVSTGLFKSWSGRVVHIVVISSMSCPVCVVLASEKVSVCCSVVVLSVTSITVLYTVPAVITLPAITAIVASSAKVLLIRLCLNNAPIAPINNARRDTVTTHIVPYMYCGIHAAND